jgi:hypothetical protein
LVIAIVVSGGFELSFGQFRLSARTVYNPLQIFWVLVALWLWLRFRPAIGGGSNPGFNGGASMRLLAGAAIFIRVMNHEWFRSFEGLCVVVGTVVAMVQHIDEAKNDSSKPAA